MTSQTKSSVPSENTNSSANEQVNRPGGGSYRYRDLGQGPWPLVRDTGDNIPFSLRVLQIEYEHYPTEAEASTFEANTRMSASGGSKGLLWLVLRRPGPFTLQIDEESYSPAQWGGYAVGPPDDGLRRSICNAPPKSAISAVVNWLPFASPSSRIASSGIGQPPDVDGNLRPTCDIEVYSDFFGWGEYRPMED